MKLIRLGMHVLLSTAVLAASTTPLALRHCHAGGLEPHHHASHQHAHSHGPGHTHCHHDEPAAPASISASACHLHLLWLGIEFSMPLGHGERGHEPHQHLLCRVVVCEHDCLKRGPDAPRAGILVAAAPQMPAPLAQQATVLCAAQFTFAPLCDVARLARTGVLRA